MKKNTIITLIVAIAIIVGGGSFYAGMVFGKNMRPSAFGGRGNFANFGQGAGSQFGGIAQKSGQNNSGGLVSGQIISKDDKSITVSLRSGGSKIVLFSATTAVLKSVSGSAEDLTTGKQVMAVGTSNQDGSISAQSIQLQSGMATSTPPVQK